MNRLSGLFHNKIHSLWNRPESLLSENGARYQLNRDVAPFSTSLSGAGSPAQPLLPTRKFTLCGTGPKAC